MLTSVSLWRHSSSHYHKKNPSRKVGIFCCLYVSLNSFADVAAEGGDVLLEGGYAFWGDGAGGAGHLALEALFYGYVARLLEFVNLYAQVTRRSTRLLAQIDKIGTLNAQQNRHYGQSQFGV